ncbi:methanol--corrinoid protein co-methyltransferase MtaB [Methanohalophilus euhalobius]|uniref:Methanol--corrinoid methyltransferase n=1 Tax=Methanohalophilus euhalobius TaxID=51203 RepID=A0A314ZTU2_9EURY|nr:methanol--corrinoid protein co-methyltransferase MtaB [Methanohalophilus euhalobius]PQV43348.1 methanol:corrinoid methyltransferase [Methanohalophilus euhalobius]RNI07588.1 methanol--corrinoid methyltransferase [Methanohalophilus euhalobius]
MSVKRYSSMEYDNFEDLLFGHSKYPVKTGLGLEIGAGYTTAEINYAPRPGAAENKTTLVNEYERITRDILERMVQIGSPSVVLETEHVQQMTNNPIWGGEVANAQKAIMEDYHDEYGIKCALRHTVGDIRGDRESIDLRGDAYSRILESFDQVASSGADMLSIESLGGKEVFDHSILRNDMRGVIFSVGILGVLDVEYIWRDICSIARKNNVVAAGDTACAQANTAMFIAGGLLDFKLSHSLAAVVRAISASRSLAAYEAGAIGPGKDCGYENNIIKAITGHPISQEGKGSTCAHSDLMGNMAMQCCDLWSNESVEYRGDFGGTTVQCWGETLSYDCSMMNTALEAGVGKTLRDVLMVSDRYRDPQAFILSYDNAYRIGEVITAHPDDLYLRAKEAGMKACELIESGSGGYLELSKFEKATIKKAQNDLKSLDENMESFIDNCLNTYSSEVDTFNPSNYGL